MPGSRAPWPAPLHMLWLGYDFDGYFRWRRSCDGDPFALRMPNFGYALFTGTPSGARELMQAPRELMGPFVPNPIEPLVGAASVLLAADPVHRRDRGLIMPAFHRARIAAYGTIIRDATADEMLGRGTGPEWRAGARIDVRAAARAITLRVILDAVYGIDSRERRADYTAATTEFVTAFSGPLLLVPALRRSAFGRGPWARFTGARDRMNALVRADLARRRGGDPGTDILGLLLAAEYDDGSRPTDDELLDQLRTLLVAGHETTATALMWALYRLHRTPETLHRLRAELDTLGPDPQPDELAKLAYLGAVCDETLRLHPPVPFMLRRLTGPATLLGEDLSAGDGVGLLIPLLHSHPDVWPDAGTFRPERFLERHYSPFEYAPYGGGHRRCLGAALADYELRIALATIVGRAVLKPTRRYASGRPPRSVPHGIATSPLSAITFEVAELRHPK